MATATIYSPSTDGVVEVYGNGTYAYVMAGSDTIQCQTANSSERCGQLHNAYGQAFIVDELFFSFDLSDYDGADVSAATLSLYCAERDSASTKTFEVLEFDWGSTLTTADWRTAAQLTSLYDGGDGLLCSCSDPEPSQFSTSAYTALTNSGTNLVDAVSSNLGGTLRVVFAAADTRSGTAPSGEWEYNKWWMADKGTTYRPKLDITYTISPKVTAASTLTGRISSSASISRTAPPGVTAASTLTGHVSSAATISRGIVINGGSTLTNDGPYSVAGGAASILGATVGSVATITELFVMTSASTLSSRVSGASVCSLGFSMAGSSQITAVVSSEAGVWVASPVVLSGASELSSVIASSAAILQLDPVTLVAASTLAPLATAVILVTISEYYSQLLISAYTISGPWGADVISTPYSASLENSTWSA